MPGIDKRAYVTPVKSVAIGSLALTVIFLVARSPLYFLFATIAAFSLTMRR